MKYDVSYMHGSQNRYGTSAKSYDDKRGQNTTMGPFKQSHPKDKETR